MGRAAAPIEAEAEAEAEAQPLPLLYSFRRCPYAMRARFAIAASRERCELREVVLRDKPAELIAASPKATVPVLVLPDGTVIDQSIDIMLWALRLNDPLGWLTPERGTLADMTLLIERCEHEFKPRLDRYKYPDRFAGCDAQAEREAGAAFLRLLDATLRQHDRSATATGFLFGARPALADMAIAPFVRQFAQVQPDWFALQSWPALHVWLGTIVASHPWRCAMDKHARWQAGDTSIVFPPQRPGSAPASSSSLQADHPS